MRSERPVRFAGVAVCLLALAGCAARTTVEQSAVELHAGSPLDFLDAVSRLPAVSNDDALHGLILAVEPEAAFAGYEERLAFARARGWIGEKNAPPAGETATVGLISVAVCDLLDVKGGVTMSLFGPSQRYCTRELVFQEFIPRRTEKQSLSGGEFVDLLGRIDDAQGNE